jgi:hypothetical protein
MCKTKKNGGMGFRGLRDFNEALLAKQRWRIITQPNILMSRVLQSKYFPHNSLWDATQKNNISYFWRSILQARWVIKKGSLWTIGNGNSINIWKDNWLPEQNGFKVLSTKPPHCQFDKVCDLINRSTNKWDIESLNQIFPPFEVDQITRIPLINPTDEDELIWAHTHNGSSIIKSGYHVIC